MFEYLLKSGLCLALLLLFYHLVLEREKMHQFNRFYLLGSVLFSFIAPSIIIYVEAANDSNQLVAYAEKTMATNQSFFDQYITLENTLITIYTLVSLVFLIRFIKNLYHIIHKIKINQIIKSDFAKFVPVSDTILPHTFWNYIFINKEEYQSQKIEEELFTHELAHVTQRHTIDVLLLEVLQIVFWFNPLFFLLKKAVQLNHEFLADDKVIASHNNISRYQSLLLNKAAWKNEYYLASNLNYSLTKKRLLMMKTPNSRTNIFLKKLALLPLLTGLVFLFANRVEAQTTKKKPQVIEVQKVISKAQMKEYKLLIKKAVKTQTFKFKEIKRMDYLYSLMSKAQKKTVENIREIMPPPPAPVKPKSVGNVKWKKDVPPKPVKIEVKEVKKRLPPPPPKQKKAIKELKELIETIEEKEEVVVEEAEEAEEIVEVVEEAEKEVIIDLINEKEVEIIETPMVEIIETPQETEVIIYEKAPRLKLDYNQLKKDGATFYLNGKKISTKKAKKYFGKKSKEVKDIEVQKENGKTLKVDISTNGKKYSSQKVKEAILKIDAYVNRNHIDPTKNKNSKQDQKDIVKYIAILDAHSNANSYPSK